MRLIASTIAIWFLFLYSAWAQAGPVTEKINELLDTDSAERQAELIAEIVGADPGWEEVAQAINSRMYEPKQTGESSLRLNLCIDGVERPWALFVPGSYDPLVPAGVLVKLHGGVSRAELIEEPLEYAKTSPWIPVADEYGWLVVQPFGQADATWWDEVGMANLSAILRTVKREYNVDDNAVYMGGFSDGASASFLQAMIAPTDYAAFAALNGHMGVGSLDGDLPTYASNLTNRPVYAVTTYDDQLYPSEKMRPTIEMARDAGADIFYREMQGEHDFAYADTELPLVAEFLSTHRRDPLRHTIIWETASQEYGQCDWFRIKSVLPKPAASWHQDHNTIMVSDRITFGFMHDDQYSGPGVRVGMVLEDTPAEECGLAEGDIIQAGGQMEITGMEDLGAYKQQLKRGSPFTLDVLRNGGTTILSGEIPEPENYFVFKRETPSALVNVQFMANHVEIMGSRLGDFSILIHPAMVNMAESVRVTVNDIEIYNDYISPNIEFMLANYLRNRDNSALYVAELKLDCSF